MQRGGAACGSPAPPAHAQVLAVRGSRARRRRAPRPLVRGRARPGPGRLRTGRAAPRPGAGGGSGQGGRPRPHMWESGGGSGGPAVGGRGACQRPPCEELRRGEALPESRARSGRRRAPPRSTPASVCPLSPAPLKFTQATASPGAGRGARKE